MVNVWSRTKQSYPSHVVVCKSGEHYESFGGDAVLFSNLAGTPMNTLHEGTSNSIAATRFRQELAEVNIGCLTAVGRRVIVVDNNVTIHV